jgi:tetratricopeptide (TPR) repeat protein
VKPALSSPIEERTRTFLTELLMNVPIMRAQGTPEQFLALLHRAILFYPAFLNWASPIDGWLTEAEQISRDLDKLDTLADVMLRRAVVHMRRLEYDAARAELDRLRDAVPQLSPAQAAWQATTRVRILTRQHEFDEARRVLSEVASPPPEGWVAPLPLVARGELELEANDVDAAGKTLQLASSVLPFELVEERVQVLQSLAFVFITKVNAPQALQYLDEARQILRGAGVWAEVVQMNLAVGSFHTAAGNPGAAQALFAEAVDLCEQYPQPQLAPLLRVALARSKAASGNIAEAVDAVLQAARLYAEQSNVVGFVSMIVLIANLYLDDKNYVEAYRVLATGVGIARHRNWAVVENVLRRHINRLRDEVMGAARFDAMVREMIDQTRRPQ